METKKLIFGLLCLGLFLSFSIYAYINKDTLFQQRMVKKYPNGCVEIYINGMLNTTPCVPTSNDDRNKLNGTALQWYNSLTNGT